MNRLRWVYMGYWNGMGVGGGYTWMDECVDGSMNWKLDRWTMHVSGWINWWSDRSIFPFSFLSKINNGESEYSFLKLIYFVYLIGVYLTSLTPSVGKNMIVETCWGLSFYPRLVEEGRVDYVIRVRLPKSIVKKATQKREVYLHEGKLILDGYDWEDSKVPDY